MVYIPPKEKTDFEKVVVDEWVTGEIVGEDIFKNVDQKFTNKQGETEIRKVDQVRFKFKLDGYEFPHYSRRMTLSTSEKSNLFKFLQQIYGDNIVPDIAVNTEKLKGLRIKTMWINNKDFQNLTQIRPLTTPPAIWEVVVDEHTTEEAPF
jgi:hypothetical protein